jgi:HD-GYP domain-containing protein (c-di-GMP phosphodiesterase class II)
MSDASAPAFRRRRLIIAWALTWMVLVVGQVAASVLPGEQPLWVSPVGLFVIVVIAASSCAVAAGVVVAVGWRDDTSELGLLGSFTMAVSVLPLVHGITAPGVWYGPNEATMSSVFWALPVASLAVVPLVAPRARWSRAVSRRWRPFVAAHLTLVFGLAVGLLVDTSLLPVWPMGSATSICVAVVAVSVCAGLSYRQVRLAMIAGSWKPLVVSVGFVFVGVSSLVWVGRAPYTLGFWLAHAFDIVGVLLLALGAVRVLRQREELRQVLRPLTVHTPLAAFDLGLDPLVHRFVASLERKDPITRDHVVRSAELAMAVGERLGIDGHDLQLLGLGALLHDIGKLEVPDAILNKDGRLTPEEYEVVKAHAAVGDSLVRASVVLAPIGPIVRGHHERYDGTGYPDGLSGCGTPIMARIVSVCDAFDAMAQTRQYRQGMGEERAISILREHSGSQWDPEIVEALVAVVGDGRIERGALSDVGRRHDHGEELRALRCGCADAIPPDEATELLATT